MEKECSHIAEENSFRVNQRIHRIGITLVVLVGSVIGLNRHLYNTEVEALRIPHSVYSSSIAGLDFDYDLYRIARRVVWEESGHYTDRPWGLAFTKLDDVMIKSIQSWVKCGILGPMLNELDLKSEGDQLTFRIRETNITINFGFSESSANMKPAFADFVVQMFNYHYGTEIDTADLAYYDLDVVLEIALMYAQLSYHEWGIPLDKDLSVLWRFGPDDREMIDKYKYFLLYVADKDYLNSYIVGPEKNETIDWILSHREGLGSSR